MYVRSQLTRNRAITVRGYLVLVEAGGNRGGAVHFFFAVNLHEESQLASL